MTPKSMLILAGAGLLSLPGCAHRSNPPTPQAEPVEIGYGAQPKEKVTGAVTSLSEKDFSAHPLRLEDLLRGKVPGLQIIQGPNGATFRIRGTNSLLADQEPLVVVDGVMIPTQSLSSALAGLTPDDIKQVNVLKDVASTSIYGMRGAGGVIVISTKR